MYQLSSSSRKPPFNWQVHWRQLVEKDNRWAFAGKLVQSNALVPATTPRIAESRVARDQFTSKVALDQRQPEIGLRTGRVVFGYNHGRVSSPAKCVDGYAGVRPLQKRPHGHRAEGEFSALNLAYRLIPDKSLDLHRHHRNVRCSSRSSSFYSYSCRSRLRSISSLPAMSTHRPQG